MDKIKQEVADRKITYLLHFTACSNLESICKEGLLSRKKLKDSAITYDYNDYDRYDGLLNTISVSISFPNYKMFYYMREQSKKECAVIAIDSSILYEENCLFCKKNAASREISKQRISERRGITAFKKMFYNDDNIRERLGLPSYYTTDPQAEVLVEDIIKVEKILRIIFENDEVMNKYKNKIPDSIEMCVDPSFFNGRIDSEHWRGK